MILDFEKRETPKRYFERAIELYSSDMGPIVEIGCMRGAPPENWRDGTSDGHSTMWWDSLGVYYYSVDNNPEHNMIALEHAKYGSHYVYDGIKFLHKWVNGEFRIGLLFLDAWDLNLPESAKKHFEALVEAIPKMAEKSIIMIDDTDCDYDEMQNVFIVAETPYAGKGRLAIPYARNHGYKIDMAGRCTILTRGF